MDYNSFLKSLQFFETKSILKLRSVFETLYYHFFLDVLKFFSVIHSLSNLQTSFFKNRARDISNENLLLKSEERLMSFIID